MGRKLVIILDEATTENYLELASKKTEAEVNADCEPSGMSLRIDIAPAPYESAVSIGSDEIGIALVDFRDD